MSASHLDGRGRGEDGMTLAEIVVAVAILGLAVVTIVGGMAGVGLASDAHRKQTNVDATLRSYAEAIEKRVSDGTYVPCTTAPQTVYAIPSGTWVPYDTTYTPSITGIKYLSSTGTFTTGTCTTDLGAQMLTLQVTSSDRRDVETLDIVIRTP